MSNIFNDPSCIRLYKFNNNLQDSISKSFCTANVTEYVKGKIDNALYGSYINNTITTIPVKFSISFFLLDKSTTSAYRRWIGPNYWSFATTGYTICLREEPSNKLSLICGSNNSSITYVKDNIWKHVCLVCDGATCKAYLDGINFATVNHTNQSRTGIWIAGTSTAENVIGYIDNLRIYNRDITSNEILQLKNENRNNVIDNKINTLINPLASLPINISRGFKS